MKIRSSRLHKFKRKNIKLFIFIKVIAVWYIVIFTGSYLSSNTSAYFSSTSEVNGVLQAGTWEKENPDNGPWDNSSLSFNGNDQTINSCSTTNISVDIKNSGNNMEGKASYEVYYAENGNPKKGVKVGEGTILAISSNDSISLSYDAEKPGNYKFKAYQRPGHPGQGELWSQTISITCDKQSDASSTNDGKDTDKNQDNPNKTDSDLSNLDSQQNTESKQSDQQNDGDNQSDTSSSKNNAEKVESAENANQQANDNSQNANKDGANK